MPWRIKEMPMAKPAGPLLYTWWAQRWYSRLELRDETFARRLASAYRESVHHRVYLLEARPGEIVAQMTDRNEMRYGVRITMPTVPDGAWERVGDALAEDPAQLAALLARMPSQQFERLLADQGVQLFPTDLRASCTCLRTRDGELCTHAAAVLIAFALRLESDPTLLLTLLGCSRERLIEIVRARWDALAAKDEPEQKGKFEDTGLPDRIDPADFFGSARPLPDEGPAIVAPQIEMAILKRLGRPPFAAESEDIEASLAPLYALVTRRALQTWDRSAVTPTRGRKRRHN
jgi:uncharacterized Zn finger protein